MIMRAAQEIPAPPFSQSDSNDPMFGWFAR